MKEGNIKNHIEVFNKEVENRKDLIKNIDEKAIRALCLEYDLNQGEYPEHMWEGDAIFNFFRQYMANMKLEETNKNVIS